MRCFGNQTSAGGLCIRHKAEKPPWTSSCLRRVSTRPGALAPTSFGLKWWSLALSSGPHCSPWSSWSEHAANYILGLLRLVLVPVRAGGRGIRRATRRMRRTPEARLIHPWWLNFKYSLWLFLCVCQMLNKVRKKTKDKKKHHKKNKKP